MTPKLLLVDDRPANLLALEGTLAVLDVECIRATSGTQALDLALDHDFALILMDVQMPGMSGFEAADLFHGTSNTRHVPIIFVTALSTDARHVSRAYETGAVDYLFKPIDTDILLSKVRVFVKLYEQKALLAEQQERLQDVISRLESTQEELERSNAELERFAFVAAHDLQAPVSAMQSFTDMLERHVGDALDEKGLHYLNRIRAGGQRMSNLIQDLLVYSRVGRRGAELAEVALGGVVQDALTTLEESVRAGAALVEVGDLPIVRGYRSELQRLFENLIGNAIKYRGDAAPRIAVTAEQQGGQLVVSVRDNGIGIEEQYQDRVFKIFERLHGGSKYSGTGVGLAIVCKVVEHHGGRIWLESESGVGSVFRFTLGK